MLQGNINIEHLQPSWEQFLLLKNQKKYLPGCTFLNKFWKFQQQQKQQINNNSNNNNNQKKKNCPFPRLFPSPKKNQCCTSPNLLRWWAAASLSPEHSSFVAATVKLSPIVMGLCFSILGRQCGWFSFVRIAWTWWWRKIKRIHEWLKRKYPKQTTTIGGLSPSSEKLYAFPNLEFHRLQSSWNI